MHVFLRSIADGYFRSEGLNITSYTFVFPNSRSAKYFSNYLGEKKDFEGRNLRTLCLTMTELFEKGAGLKRASHNRLLMSVYSAYCDVSRRLNPDFKPEEFDRFRFWAEMLLKDFDEADRYLIDPDQLFRNVSEYKEIQSYYLTPEQQAIIRDFWGDDPYWGRLYGEGETAAEQPEVPFWAHIGKKNGSPVRKFMQLWEMLLPIYKELHRMLEEKKLCYPGMACREVVRKLKTTGRLPFNPKKYVFVGFNRLTTAEHVVFDELQKLGQAHFYWDYDPGLMNPDSGNKAGRFIARYRQYFRTSLPAVTLPAGGGRHTVEVIGVGSGVGQAKVAAQLLERADTAVVLPTEEMLLPLVASIPERFEQINVTMGYPLRFSQLSQVYSALAMLQTRARRHPTGAVEFFRSDVMRLLSHPLLRAVCDDELTAIAAMMKEQHLFNLTADRIERMAAELPIMSVLMAPVANPNEMADVAQYSRCALDILEEHSVVTGIDRAAISTLRSQIDELEALSAEFGVRMVDNTFFHLLERAVFQRSLPLSGVTFDALQIMGVLETRALGFRNVMMLSMTDSVFPGRISSRSFIPESLRRAYGMPTAEHYESDAAYYFFRILSHAERLTLLYDSRMGGLRSGEKSRFIEQLIHIGFPGVDVTCSDAVFTSNLATTSGARPLIPADTAIRKDARIMERLNRYRNPAYTKEFKLSASSLKTYLHCPFQFYLERVEDIRPADSPKENIDAGTIGNIIHEVAERLYKELPVRNITESVIRELIADGYDGLLGREVRRSFNANYVGIPRTVTNPETGEKIPNPEVTETPLHGQSYVYEPTIREAVIEMLHAEPVPFRFIAGELARTFSWQLLNGIALNFTMKIDRVDEKAGIIRLVDYKSGKDHTDFTDGNIFARESISLRAGIFQLLTYCYAYTSLNPQTDSSRLKPLIYTLKEIPREGTFADLTYGSGKNARPLESYAQVAEMFEDGFNNLIGEIFNPEIPFRRTDKSSMCTFCKFQRLCHTEPLKKWS